MGATVPVACLKFTQMQQTTLGSGANIMTKIQQLLSNAQYMKLDTKAVESILQNPSSF